MSARSPIFAAAVVEQSDVGALFAVPLQWETINLGVLGLYRKAPGSLSGAQLRDAMSAADMAAPMLLGCAPIAVRGRGWTTQCAARAEIH
jgi:hypothetical protein